MKTLVFCAGAKDPDLSVLQQISSDLLIGVDKGAATLVAHGYTPDYAIGDFDSSEPPEQCRHVIRLPADKDDTDLEVALLSVCERVGEENISQIIIVGALGAGRLDHLLTNIWLAHQPRFAPYLHKIRMVEVNSITRFFGAGEHVWLHEADKKYVSFIGLTPIKKLSIKGVKYPVEAKDYPSPVALVSNECLGSMIRFSLEEGILCVVQSND